MLKKEIFLSNFKAAMDANPEMNDYLEEKAEVVQACDELFGPHEENITMKEQLETLVKFLETYQETASRHINDKSAALDIENPVNDLYDLEMRKLDKEKISLNYEGFLLNTTNSYLSVIQKQPVTPGENVIKPGLLLKLAKLIFTPSL